MKTRVCSSCNGSGRKSCSACGGSGIGHPAPGFQIGATPDLQIKENVCNSCGGTGEITCPQCQGTGQTAED